jgi:hypothetical protein
MFIRTTFKQTSPISFPKFSNAFKPFKKRAKSFHHLSPHNGINLAEANGTSNGHDNKKSIEE